MKYIYTHTHILIFCVCVLNDLKNKNAYSY